MTIHTALFSSKSGEHETPQKLYDRLHAKYKFTLDPCCTHENHKCDEYLTIDEDGLFCSWQGHTVFMNPPYGRDIGPWIEKAYSEWRKGNCQIVGLLPARVDTRWFHKYVYRKVKWEPLKGRLRFEIDGKPQGTAPFPRF